MSSQEQNSNKALKQTQASPIKKKKIQPPPDLKKPKKTE